MLVGEITIPRWLLFSMISSLLCILGAFCVPLMSKIFGSKRGSSSLLINYGLSLSAGSMVTTSLYKLLPQVTKENKYRVFFGTLGGVCISLLLNHVVHSYASESLVHCAHGDHSENEPRHIQDQSSADFQDEEGNIHHDSHEELASNHHDGNNSHSRDTDDVTEYEPLLTSQTHKSLNRKKSLYDVIAKRGSDECDLITCAPLMKTGSFSCVPPALIKSNSIRHHSHGSIEPFDSETNNQLTKHKCGIDCVENTIGYDLENLSLYRKNFHAAHNKDSESMYSDIGSTSNDEDQITESPNHGHDMSATISHHVSQNHSIYHHHHVETPFSKLLSIGMQTCLVLTLHKFPEGFIIFYTNNTKTPSSLGLSIFISLTIHNFVEGFAMTLPFYAVFKNKWLAVLITVVLGGGSQPLGALIGYLIFKDKPKTDTGLEMDFYLSITSGFLLVIALQMFQTGIGFSDGHHHHEGEDNAQIAENHSLGTTCLKWCCAGALLIIASSMFTQ